MALSYIEAENGYPIALLPSATFPEPRPSEGTTLVSKRQEIYSQFTKNIITSKNARKRRRSILTVNTGPQMLATVAEALNFKNGDSLYILERQARRTETASTLAQRLNLNPESSVISQGNFLTGSYFEISDLINERLQGQRLDYIVFGLGSPSVDRSRNDGPCRIQAEITKASELLREGGSLVMAPPLLDAFCVETALRNSGFQTGPEKSPQLISNLRAMRAIALR